MKITQTKYNIGDVIQHKLFDFRGVIVDVDADFQGDDKWYEKHTVNSPSKDQPWYHVLVDDDNGVAYVSEQNVHTDGSETDVSNTMIDMILASNGDGKYQPLHTLN